MTSYAELLQTCAEFQDNFSVLNGKYSSLAQELQNEKDAHAALRRKLEAAAKREEQLEDQVRTLRQDLEVASGYKDKLAAATIALEHMKSRLESARRGVADTLAEHDQEVAQLKAQIKDLLQRVELAADGAQVRELKKQNTELGERASVAVVALQEERERFSQQLLIAHNALREQQARNLELVQRYRAVEGEVTEMRAAVRRSAELQGDAAILKERHASEAAVAQRAVAAARGELEQVRQQLREEQRAREEELAAARLAADEESAAARNRIATLTAAVAERTAAAEKERGRYVEALRSTQQRIEAARDEATAELTALRRAVSHWKEEAQRAQQQADELRAAAEASERAAKQQQAGQGAMQAQLAAVERQLTAAAQQEAWLCAERAHASERLAAAERRAEELAAALQGQERTLMDLERAKMRGAVLEDEVAAARSAAAAAETRARDIEDAAGRRLTAMRRDVKSYRKQLSAERAVSDGLRRRLLQALAQREADAYCSKGRAGEAMEPSDAGVARGGNISSACDVIGILKQQNEDAQRLHEKLMELSH